MICRRCNNDLPDEAFSVNRKKASGRCNWCRDCISRYTKNYRDGVRLRERLPETETHKTCTVCKRLRPKEYFRKTSGKGKTASRQLRPECTECSNNAAGRRLAEIKRQVIEHYTNGSMACQCGFSDIRALSIDHISGGGNKERQAGRTGYAYYLKHRPTNVQVLCMNCQFIKRHENGELKRRVWL